MLCNWAFKQVGTIKASSCGPSTTRPRSTSCYITLNQHFFSNGDSRNMKRSNSNLLTSLLWMSFRTRRIEIKLRSQFLWTNLFYAMLRKGYNSNNVNYFAYHKNGKLRLWHVHLGPKQTHPGYLAKQEPLFIVPVAVDQQDKPIYNSTSLAIYGESMERDIAGFLKAVLPWPTEQQSWRQK